MYNLKHTAYRNTLAHSGVLIFVCVMRHAEKLRPLFLRLSLLYCERQGIDLAKNNWIEMYLGME